MLRPKVIYLRVTPEKKREIEEAAAAAYMNLTGWLMRAIDRSLPTDPRRAFETAKAEELLRGRGRTRTAKR